MKRRLLIGGAIAALTSTLAFAQPENLLPGGFDDPPPQPTPAPIATPTQAAPVTPTPSAPAPSNNSAPVVQSLPSAPSTTSAGSDPAIALPANLPTLEELEAMESDEVNDLFGLRPKFDIPPAARRSTVTVGVLASNEGGFQSASLARQPAALVRAALEGTRGPLVSRWGHILLRRALASRMDAPVGMSPVEFAALRAALLNRMGEAHIARALVQDVDSDNFDRALTDAAFDAYLGTGDLLGMCPVALLQPDLREDGEWIMIRAICDAYRGEARRAERRLQRALGTGEAPEIDVRLAQRFAGAAGDGSRAVTIEWEGVDELNRWRFALARALGVDLPENLRAAAPASFDFAEALIPAAPLADRVRSADRAGSRGVMSASAMVDLYAQLYASDGISAAERQSAIWLREAYVAADPLARTTAMRSLWGEGGSYGLRVLTAYAAARLPVTEALEDDAFAIIGSMLAAGLDGNAMRWGSQVPEGSQAWGLLALAQPERNNPVSADALDDFISDDASEEQRRSGFLIAGLAGLGRVDAATIAEYSDDLSLDLARSSAWSARITQAGEYRNGALVALLAGLGMQGNDWQQMTPRHLFHIVRALDAVGLNAEARMIAAEAVARA